MTVVGHDGGGLCSLARKKLSNGHGKLGGGIPQHVSKFALHLLNVLQSAVHHTYVVFGTANIIVRPSYAMPGHDYHLGNGEWKATHDHVGEACDGLVANCDDCQSLSMIVVTQLGEVSGQIIRYDLVICGCGEVMDVNVGVVSEEVGRTQLDREVVTMRSPHGDEVNSGV